MPSRRISLTYEGASTCRSVASRRLPKYALRSQLSEHETRAAKSSCVVASLLRVAGRFLCVRVRTAPALPPLRTDADRMAVSNALTTPRCIVAMEKCSAVHLRQSCDMDDRVLESSASSKRLSTMPALSPTRWRNPLLPEFTSSEMPPTLVDTGTTPIDMASIIATGIPSISDVISIMSAACTTEIIRAWEIFPKN